MPNYTFMFLKRLKIKNFRNLENLEITFNKGVNVVIGENNSGKTALFDVLRICLGFGDRYRDIYINKSDFFIDLANPDQDLPKIQFDLIFAIEEELEAAIFRDLLVEIPDGSNELQMHHEYYYENVGDIEKLRYKVWGGANEGQQIDLNVLDLFKHVYLGALRNASEELKPVRGNKLGELYSKLNKDNTGRELNDEKRKEMANKIKESIHSDDEWEDLIETGLDEINKHLNQVSFQDRKQKVHIDFLPFEFDRLVDYLRIQLPIYSEEVLGGDQLKQKYFDIHQNGLGYNNLIFTATVLGNLNVINQVDPNTFIGLIIEEPEAHLHPQLQNVFFSYLNELNDKGFQLFVSSHSPTLTSKASLDDLILLQDINSRVTSSPIQELNLSPTNKEYLSKFLDVTKSQLFFANHIILVEGISEALLMQIFSEMLDDNGIYSLEKNGVEVVNVGGVSFEHFAKLYNSDSSSERLKNRCSLITDSDRDFETGEISDRAKNTRELESGNLKVYLAPNTFEYDLFIENDYNKDVLLGIFENLHPQAFKNIEAGDDIEEHAYIFLKKVESNNAKSRLAHSLSIKLEKDEEVRNSFTIPTYIEQAIKDLFE